MDSRSTIITLALAFTILLPLPASSVGTMTTLGPMWSKSANPSWDAREPNRNSFVLCVLESGTLRPQCSGTYPMEGNSTAPNVPMLGLSSGGLFTCGLSYDTKKPLCWGNPNASVPVTYTDLSYSSLSAGHGHVCALRSGGVVDCWGSDDYKQLNVPQNGGFVQISSGYDYTCGLKDTGKALCWGWDRSTPEIDQYRPQPVNSILNTLYSGGTHICGLERSTSFAVCWGWNNYGQSNNPAGVAFSSLALGLFHSCGILKGSGTVVCWGDSAFQQTLPPKTETFSVIAAGDYYTCGVSLNNSHRVKCWGNSVEFNGTFEVGHGLCMSQDCSSSQYQASGADADTCPSAGDRVCLDCLQGNTQCTVATPHPSSVPTPSSVPGPSRSPAAPVLNESRTNTKNNAVGAAAGAGVAAVLLVAGGLVGFVFWRRSRSSKSENWKSLANRLVPFNNSELIAATNNYRSDMILGRGASGVVYKAVLPDGRTLALKKSKAGDKTLVKELSLLARVHHTYLVNLVGYCAQEQLLAFEFMENGSLFDCLFKKPEIRLDCFMRIRIAAQVARGLEYLHVYASPQILHRDIKTANILLDGDWNAHLSDFGFSFSDPAAARSRSNSSQHQFMTMVGTPGYMDPEYFQTMQFTAKSDVYSFGVVLLELLTGRRAMISSERSLVSWILQHAGSSSEYSLFDPTIFFPENAAAMAEVLKLAMQCTSQKISSRSDISYVASTLERVLSGVVPENNSFRSSTPFSSSSY